MLTFALGGGLLDTLFVFLRRVGFCIPSCQGCGVGAGVGVAGSRGNEPGVGVGVDQIALTPTPERCV